MKLLDEIVELLSTQGGSLSDALLKTKVLMRTLGQNDLAQWVDDELKGYDPATSSVPPYRVVPSRLMGTLVNSHWRHPNQMLPIDHLPPDLQKTVSEAKLLEPIGVLEQFAANRKGALTMPISSSFKQTFGDTLIKNGHLESMWSQIELSQINGLLIEVRTKLLDFILELRSQLGDNVSSADVKKAGEKIDVAGMFQGAMIGDGATFVLGDHNTTNIKNNIKKGNFESLAAELKKQGVEQADIAVLQTAITQDKGAAELKEKKFGPAVKGWMSKMMGKAIDASWQIELGVAGGLLTEALKAFYF